MTKYYLIGAMVLTSLIACSPDQAPAPPAVETVATVTVEPVAQAEPTVEEIESVVRKYFDHFSKYDFEGMRSMATPDFETLDGGIRLTHPELEDWVRNSAQLNGVELDFEVSQIRTRISDDVAYSTFLLTYGDTASTDLVALRRIDNEWLVDIFDHQHESSVPEAVVRQF
jgi:hypothetical protein